MATLPESKAAHLGSAERVEMRFKAPKVTHVKNEVGHLVVVALLPAVLDPEDIRHRQYVLKRLLDLLRAGSPPGARFFEVNASDARDGPGSDKQIYRVAWGQTGKAETPIVCRRLLDPSAKFVFAFHCRSSGFLAG